MPASRADLDQAIIGRSNRIVLRGDDGIDLADQGFGGVLDLGARGDGDRPPRSVRGVPPRPRASLLRASELVSPEFQIVPIVLTFGAMARNKSKFGLTGGTV